MQQARGQCYGGELPEDIETIRSDGGTLEPLDDDEIDSLCEQINVTPDPAIIVVGCEGGLVQGASSNIEGLSMIVLDYDTEGADDDEITEVPQSDTVELEPAIVGLHIVAHDAPWIQQICDAVGVKGLREQINTKPAEPHITIPPEAWEPTGSGDPAKPEEGDDPTSRLLTSVWINGTPMHLEAYAVTDEDGQRAADEAFADDLASLQNIQDTSFRTTTINEREYVLVATPHGD